MAKRSSGVALGLLALWASPAEAQPSGPSSPPARLDAITVTSTRQVGGTPLSNVPGSITVLERREIEQQAGTSNDLGDVLAKTVPGFSPSTEALTNFGQTLRGRRFLVLIDGVPQSTPLRDASRDLKTIDPAAIERIEVIRGATAVYGFGAAGGIVNIITRQAEEGAPSFSTRIGANASLTHPDDSLGGSLTQTASGKVDRYDYLLSLTGETVGGFFDAEGDRIPPDPIAAQGGLADTNAIDFLGKVGATFDAQRLQLTAKYYEIKQDTNFITRPGVLRSQKAEATPGDPQGDKPGNEDFFLNLDYRHEDVLGGGLSAQLYYQDLLRRFTFFPGFGQTQIETERFGARVALDTEITPLGATLTWGLDLQSDESGQPFVDQPLVRAPFIQQYGAAPFAQIEIPVLDRFLLRGGARYEVARLEVDDFTNRLGAPVQGGRLTLDEPLFNAGLVYFLNDEVELFASFSQGFSLADFGRVLADSATPISTESFDAAGQKVDSYEIGARGDWGRFDGSVALFYSESELGTSFGGPPDFLIRRRPEEIYGVEFTANFRATDQIRLGGTVALLEGETDTDGDGDLDAPLDGTRISPPKLTAYVEYDPFPWWRNRVQVLHVGGRDEFPGSAAFGEGEVDSFTTVDLLAEFDVGPGTLQLGVENLLNNQYFPAYAQAANAPSDFYAGQGARLYTSYRIRY